MNKNKNKQYKYILTGGMALAFGTSGLAQEKPYTQAGTSQPPPPPPKPAATATATPGEAPAAPEPNAVEKLFNIKIPEAIAKGKFNLNARLRYEFVDQDGVPAITKESNAATIRTRFGYTSAPLYGFQGMIEGEDIRVIGPEHNYNAAGSNGQPNRPVVADPPTTELNQAWLSYSYTNLVTVKGGRERIVLDNHRFVGDGAWRQNMQTYDAITAEVKPIKDLSLLYGYVWDVRRSFGDVDGLPPANTDFQSSSHLINISYTPCQYGRIVGYTYLLDLKNDAGAANSCATYGAYFAGSAPVMEKLSLGYRAEFAEQTDYGDSLLDYSAEYYNIELSANYSPFAVGAGYEVLGSDNGASVRTPLATLHQFNGWADVFLTTPAAGLRDLYGFAQVTFPWELPLRFIYHKFDADSGGGDFGQEFDVILSKKFGKYWGATLKYACYLGEDAAPPSFAQSDVDVQKFWAQVEFNY